MKKTVKLIMSEEQAEWFRKGLGEIRVASMAAAASSQVIHYTYWKLTEARGGSDVPPIRHDVGGAVIDMSDVVLA